MENIFDLVVIGAGPGGYEAAIEAAEKGMSVAIVEKEALGGTCLNHGCIPTKTLMHSADIYRELKSVDELGINIGEASYSMERIQARKNEVVDQLRSGVAGLMKKNKIQVFEGTGSIRDKNVVVVKAANSGDNETILKTKYILIATGSVTAVPPIKGAELEGVVTSDELLERTEKAYDHLLVIGGGVIGMEFASIYSSLGAKVTVIEALDRILANMDKEIAQNLKMILKKRGVEIHAASVVNEIRKDDDGSLTCVYTEKGRESEVKADGILLAVGRRANTEDLFDGDFSLETERGKICVNENYQTSIDNIYAAGDVIGGVMLAHAATAEGKRAVAHMNGETSSIDISVVPGCVYTDPEIASVGISAEDAKAKGIAVDIRKYVMSANGKSILSGQERGFIKVIADKENGKILGAQMMCARATDMISELAAAIVNELTLEDMASVVRPHPTFSEGITEAVR